MAVEVALDAIKQARWLQVRTGTYMYSSGLESVDDKDLRDLMPELRRLGCVCCALGACLVSKARLYDKVPAIKISSTSFSSAGSVNINPYREDVVDLLKGVFTRSQMDLIESAFEKTSMGEAASFAACSAAADFGRRYEDDRRRFFAIMRNIVENGGVFIPKIKERTK